MSSYTDKQLLELEDVVIELLAPGKKPFNPLLWIDNRAAQMGLRNQVDSEEIFREAYLRSRKFIKDGNKIENYIGWLRNSCLLILKEERTKIIRARKNTEKIVREEMNSGDLNSLDECISPEFVNKENVLILQKARGFINKRDNELLNMRIVEGLEWKKIKQRIDEDIPLTTLRKRGERAVSKLRKVFYSIKEDM